MWTEVFANLRQKLGRRENDTFEQIDAHVTKKGMFITTTCMKTAVRLGNHREENLRVKEKPTTFLDQVYLCCTPLECKSYDGLVQVYRTMLESRISAGATEKLPDSGRGNEQVITWSFDMAGHARK